ncbi:hypothetical protein [Helicobacter pylori]|nr:hypothetical protein [Helicobacter pylori]
MFFYILEATEKAELKQVIQTLEQKEITLKNDLKADYEWILTAELARAEP